MTVNKVGNRLVLSSKKKKTANEQIIERWAQNHTVNKVVAGDGVTIQTQSQGQGAGNEGTGILTISAAGGSGTIEEITSTGGTVTITDPTGPVTNIEVSPMLFPGTLLGATSYFGNYSTTDGSSVIPVDSGNLTVTVTPETEQILVQFSGLFSCDDGASFELDVLNGSSLLDFPNCLAVILQTYPRGGDTTALRYATISYLLTVVPGTTYDINPGWVNLADNGTTLYIANVDGPAFVVAVWAVP